MSAQSFLILPDGQKMPVLGLGTFLARDETEVENAVEEALKLGYRHIDTAWVYENERIIGKVLNRWISSGRISREELFITTKLPQVGVHPDRVETFMKKSLENLGLDYVDLYLIHFPVGLKFSGQEGLAIIGSEIEGKTDHVGIWRKMEEQVEAGRAKNIGLSNFNIAQITTILKHARIRPANLQVEVHLYLQQHELVNFCLKNGITVVAYCPLGNPGFNDFLKKIGRETVKLPDILNNPVVSRLAKKYGKTPAQIALRFLLDRGVSTIPKSVTPKRIKENFEVFDFALKEEDLKELYHLDVGEQARIGTFRLIQGIDQHPDYPFETT